LSDLNAGRFFLPRIKHRRTTGSPIGNHEASKMHAEELNGRFGIPGKAEVVEGNGGLPKIKVTTPAATAEIYLQGAQVTSWRPDKTEEAIFLSERSYWQNGRAIRGGIPVCFPWFRAKSGDPKAPAHGFVRTREWNLENISNGSNGTVSVVCSTESDAMTRRWWPYDFCLAHRITVGETLLLELTVTNTGGTCFRFEEALHTYFRVGDVARVRVSGLDGLTYLDNADGNREKPQSGDLILTGPTDNAYMRSEGSVHIDDGAIRRTLTTEKGHSATTVVWNPWQQGAADLADLGEDQWHRMLCVEASNILAAAVQLEPGQEHTMRATLSISAT
jgi:glucose-6-phosphate 1-epimerase